MAYADPQLLHLDSMLTGISVGYSNVAFVAETLFPSVRVAKQSDKYYVHDKDRFFVVDDRRAPRSRTNEVPPMSLSRDTYFAEEHALLDMVPIEEEQNADNPLDPMVDATERVTEFVLNKREDIVQTLARTAANYATGHTVTLSGTDQWSDYTNSDPIDDIKTGRDKVYSAILRFPNVMVLGYSVAAKLEDHPDFIERIKYSQRGVTTDEIIASIVGIPRVVRAAAVKATSALGQTVTTDYMWGKDVVIAFAPERPGRRVPAYGYEFTWPYEGGGIMPTERWYDQDLKSTKVRVSRRYDHKFAAVDSVTSGKAIGGYLIKSAIA